MCPPLRTAACNSALLFLLVMSPILVAHGTSKKQRKVLVLEEGRFKKGARIRWTKEKEQDETSKDVLASILYFL